MPLLCKLPAPPPPPIAPVAGPSGTSNLTGAPAPGKGCQPILSGWTVLDSPEGVTASVESSDGQLEVIQGVELYAHRQQSATTYYFRSRAPSDCAAP